MTVSFSMDNLSKMLIKEGLVYFFWLTGELVYVVHKILDAEYFQLLIFLT